MTKIVVLFVGLCCSAYSLLAQGSHIMTVTEPANLAGNYPAEMAVFGKSTCSVSGELVFAKSASNGTTACTATPIVTDLTGKIAVIDRGTCNFSEKVLNAQKKGAIAVIVLNNAGSTALDVMGPGTDANLVTIPSYLISQVSGNTLRAALNAGTKINIKLAQASPDLTPASQIVWGGKPTEGEFGGGLNTWKSNTISCNGPSKPANVWDWVNYPGIFAAPCVSSTGLLIFESPSACNGFMIMNAASLDLADSTNCDDGYGEGLCPAPHSAELISPTIKVTKGSLLNVSFYQALTHFFDSEYFVEWSKDGGKTWVSIQINEEIRPFEDNTEIYKLIPLKGSETADSVKIKFRYNGNYYHWAIDDVKLVKREANNLALTQFYALSPNMQQPAAQAETIPFGAAVENVGANAQSNLKLYINVIDSTTAVRVFRDSVSSVSIAPNQIDTAIFAPKYLPNKKGTFAMIYQTRADSADYNTSDNLEGFFFRVTDTTFAKELGASSFTLPGPGNWGPTEQHSAAYGNSYHIVKGKGNYLRSITFGINNGRALVNNALILSLYKWDDRNFDALVQASERTLVADNFYDITGTETARRLITVPFPEVGEPAVQLEDSTTYLVMCEYFAEGSTDLQLLLNFSYDRYPMLLAGFATDKPRYASFTALDSDLPNVTYGPAGYGWENVYVIRMNVGPLVITSDREVPSITNEFAITPNPAREHVYLQLALNQTSKQANVRVMDLSGRQIIEKVYNNVKRDQFQISIDGLPAGTYLMQVTTENGTGTKKFVKN